MPCRRRGSCRPQQWDHALADSADTANGFTSYRSTFAGGAVGAPTHFHTRATELFHVIGGTLRVLVGEEITTLEAGYFLAVPPHAPHAFAAAPGCEADVLFHLHTGVWEGSRPARCELLTSWACSDTDRPVQMQITIFPRVRPRSACAWASAIRSRG
ncbi:cupin domain-containing protein [Streptomyces sp. NPDC054904]